MTRVIIFITLIFSVSELFAQKVSYYPDQYSLFFYNLPLVNPSYVEKSGKAAFNASYKARTGPFKKIATYAFTGDLIFRKANESAHAGRVLVLSQKEGPYISRPSAYLNYAYLVPVSKETAIFAGVAVGFSGIYFSAPSASGAGSSILPDGSIGIGFRSRGFSAGLSSMQIFNSEAQPIQTAIVLKTYYNTFVSYEHDLDAYWKFYSYGLWRALPAARDDLNLALLLKFQETIGFGGVLRPGKGIAFFASLYPLEKKNTFSISAAYNSSFLSTLPSWHNSIEFTMHYTIN